MSARFHCRCPLGMDIGNHGPAGLGNTGMGLVGDIGRHALIRHKAGAFPHQHAHQLAAGHIADGVSCTHPAVAHKKGLTHLNSLALEAVLDGRQAVQSIGLDGCRGQTVTHHDLNGGGCGYRLFDDLLVLFVKAAAQIRPGKIFFLVLAFGLNWHQTMLSCKILGNLGEDRVLGGRMVRPEAKLCQGLIARACLAHTQSCGGTGF